MGGNLPEKKCFIRQTCAHFEIQILRGVVSKDHVHILISAPSNISPSEIMRRVKGMVSRKIFEEFPHVKKGYWGRDFWGRGHFCNIWGTDKRDDSGVLGTSL